MPFKPSHLRRAAFVTAALMSAFISSTGGSAITAAAIGVTTAAVVTASDAEARERVRDHRKRRCPPHAAGPGCVPR